MIFFPLVVSATRVLFIWIYSSAMLSLRPRGCVTDVLSHGAPTLRTVTMALSLPYLPPPLRLGVSMTPGQIADTLTPRLDA
jgi:hypothetical protein